MSDSDTEFEKALTELKTLQSMIDYIEQHLKGLRTQCAPNDEFTQKEIRVTEGKLVLYVSKQIIIKSKITSEALHDELVEYPNTKQWLSCVGLPENTIKGLMKEEENLSLYTLLELSETDIKTKLLKHNASNEDARRLNLSLRNLNIATERELSGGNSTSGDSDVELHWTNPESTSSYDYIARRSPRPSTSSMSSSDNSTTMSAPAQTHSTPPSPVPHAHNAHNERLRSVGYTPPPTPPSVRTPKTKYPITPPPQKKMLLFPEYPTISRSKSQESQLAHKVQDIDPVRSGKKKHIKELNLGSNPYVNISGSHDILAIRRPSNEHETGRSSRGPASPIVNSPIHSPPYVQGQLGDGTLMVPGLMGTHVMKHQINHKLITKLLFGSTCDVCGKTIFRGKQCKYCKFKCHKDCVHREAPSCGLSDEMVNLANKTYFEGASNPRRTPELQRHGKHVLPAFPVPDSSSASSSNSSTHSSPIPHGMSSGTYTSPSPYPSPHVQQIHSFQFPDTLLSESSTDVTQTEPVFSTDWDKDVDVVSTNTSNDSDKTIVDSNTSEVTLLDRVDSVDSQDDPLGQHTWKRVYSLSVALKEWDIPYEELIQDDPIGTGRFGTVYKGQWHGDVAIKMLNMDPDTDNAAQLSAFKLEVAMLRKTRHENLVLFMGACMKPPHLAIVTSLCRGSSLFTLLHVRKEKFQMSKSIIIAQQVSQGMGYLHAKGIVHKDLKTKNIFFDKDKVVITDFGLFNVTKLCHANRHSDRLQIPPGWLCYLSPEIIKSLQAGAAYANTELPFSEMSDVYAFGTVWYELLNGNWPFDRQPPESIIWQVGHGLKPSFGSIKGSKEVKDMLLVCWSFNPDDRPSFSQLLKIMERLPRKPFTRSPSHPIHLLSRSADSLHTS
ncbi:kinase suppressor of Ras 2-like isoform X2 [Mercenaria mercenaria]|uniref:kinase suppressor of Ras 2-like isoform X2 n=1 Tax=Mercenaria mercenaria TaxID=6596 RepID=UPI001E1DDEF2|nr:kinase suppressor of Ras 2-like isoform X2 [Mercenaria mercenaria]